MVGWVTGSLTDSFAAAPAQYDEVPGTRAKPPITKLTMFAGTFTVCHVWPVQCANGPIQRPPRPSATSGPPVKSDAGTPIRCHRKPFQCNTNSVLPLVVCSHTRDPDITMDGPCAVMRGSFSRTHRWPFQRKAAILPGPVTVVCPVTPTTQTFVGDSAAIAEPVIGSVYCFQPVPFQCRRSEVQCGGPGTQLVPPRIHTSATPGTTSLPTPIGKSRGPAILCHRTPSQRNTLAGYSAPSWSWPNSQTFLADDAASPSITTFFAPGIVTRRQVRPFQRKRYGTGTSVSP